MPAILFSWIFNFRFISWKAHKILHPKKNPSSSQIFFPSMSVITATDFPLFLCPFIRSFHRFSSLKSQYISSLFFSFPFGVLAVWLLYCWIVINLVLFLFSFWFRKARDRHRWGLGSSGPFFFSRLIYKKKKKDLGPLTKSLAPFEIVTQPASPHENIKNK